MKEKPITDEDRIEEGNKFLESTTDEKKVEEMRTNYKAGIDRIFDNFKADRIDFALMEIRDMTLRFRVIFDVCSLAMAKKAGLPIDEYCTTVEKRWWHDQFKDAPDWMKEDE